jgi:SAM-dependent methyltransferase
MTITYRDTDNDWKRVAETDPFWGVLSHEEYRHDTMDAENFDQFMASGEQYVANLFALIRKHLSPQFVPRRALDFGCGVGRLAIPLAKRVTETVGVDIAPAMLELCRKHAEQAGIQNISVYESDDTLSRIQGEFELINAYIVLQHIPPERGYRLLQAMLDRLAVGGVGSIQLTYAKSRKFFLHEQSRALYYRRDGGTLVDIVDTGWDPPEGTITMFDYDLNQVMAQISRVSGHPIIALPTNDDSHLGVHLIFVKAR